MLRTFEITTSINGFIVSYHKLFYIAIYYFKNNKYFLSHKKTIYTLTMYMVCIIKHYILLFKNRLLEALLSSSEHDSVAEIILGELRVESRLLIVGCYTALLYVSSCVTA